MTAWLIAIGQVTAGPFAGIKGPRSTQKLVPPPDEQLRAPLATCTTPTHRPDEPLHHPMGKERHFGWPRW